MKQLNENNDFYARLQLKSAKPFDGKPSNLLPSNIGVTVGDKSITLDFNDFEANAATKNGYAVIDIRLDRLDTDSNYQEEWDTVGLYPIDLFKQDIWHKAIISELTFDCADDNNEPIEMVAESVVFVFDGELIKFDADKITLNQTNLIKK